MRLEILSSDEIDDIHEATLRVLEETGVKVLDPHAFELLRDAGSEVDLKTSVVKIPEHVLKEGIRKAPSSFTLFGREKDYRLKFEPGRTYFSSQGSSSFVLDLETGVRRRSTLNDLKSFYVLVDASDNIDHASWVVSADDLPEYAGPARELLEAFRNTTKTVDGDTYGEKNARDSIEMASIIAGGENELRKYPRLLGFVNPVSPLEHSKLMTEGLRVFAQYEQPTSIAPEAQGGATAPVTLAGILVQQNVEVLSGILISQLTHPGAPVLYGTVSTIADMKTGNVALGAVETGLINIATAQLAKCYGLPTRGTGGATNAKVPDIQAGYEKALTLSIAAMAGINFIYDAAGMLEASRTASFEQIVLDNELCGMVLRSIHGIDVNEETMATEVIKNVGPGGHFLSQKHTLDYFTMEHYLPTILDRSTWETWQKNGSKEIRATARETARKILREHKAEPLEKTVDRELEALVKKIDSECSQETPARNST